MELIEGHYIECIDWIMIGSLSDDRQLMIPIPFKVDVLGEHILNLN
jgi:hypothetical protein